MRITRQQLQDLIDETVAESLNKAQNRRIVETHLEAGGSLYHADASSLIDFAKAYASLGVELQEKIEDLLDWQDEADIDIDSFDVIERTLRGLNEELDTAMDAWYKVYGGEDADTM